MLISSLKMLANVVWSVLSVATCVETFSMDRLHNGQNFEKKFI